MESMTRTEAHRTARTGLQVFKSVVERGWALADRLARPWMYCKSCGDRLPHRLDDGLCSSCAKWANCILRGHESSRRLRFFRVC